VRAASWQLPGNERAADAQRPGSKWQHPGNKAGGIVIVFVGFFHEPGAFLKF
jgi:hypothetical protein